jgi:hypothetical protein
LKKVLQRAQHSGRSIKVTNLATTLNISKASLYAYLAGDTLPPPDKLDDLLTELGVPTPEGRWFHELRDDIETRFLSRPKPDVLRRAAGDSGTTDSSAVDSGPPLIEITLPDGSVELADIEDSADVPDELKTLAGPYVIEHLSEYVHVDASRTITRVDCRRKIRSRTGHATLLVRVRGAARFRSEPGCHRVA